MVQTGLVAPDARVDFISFVFGYFDYKIRIENPYLTIDPQYEAEEVRELARIYQRGILYRGEKPVYWCWALQTALAEAEVEYANHKSPSIYVKFNIVNYITINIFQINNHNPIPPIIIIKNTIIIKS